MFGLIVLLTIAAYLAVSVTVVRKTMRWARATGRGAKRWGWIAGLAMYLPVFWDFIPTILLYQYLCATEQGFWIYKTVEEWQRENPGVAKQLTASNTPQVYERPGVAHGYLLNQRIAWEISETKKPSRLLPVFVHEENIVDRANAEILAKHVRIGSGYGGLALGNEGAWKFWLAQPDCNETRKDFNNFLSEMKSQGETQ